MIEACAHLDPMIVEHGYRSYVFGRALGVVEGIEADDEALFAATMFHDYAFETMDSLTDRCFTFAGAEVAAEFLESSPLPEGLRHDVLDAITLHLNPKVEPAKPLQRLAHDGIALDVLGMRGWELDQAGVRRVGERHPRHGFTVRGAPLSARPRPARPRLPGRRALLLAGFGPALKLSPWRRPTDSGLVGLDTRRGRSGWSPGGSPRSSPARSPGWRRGASRYQLEQPPSVQTDPFIDACSSSLNASWASARGSTVARRRSSIARNASIT